MNKISISYHTKMGFELVPGDAEMDGVPVHINDDELGKDRVLFYKQIDANNELNDLPEARLKQ